MQFLRAALMLTLLLFMWLCILSGAYIFLTLLDLFATSG